MLPPSTVIAVCDAGPPSTDTLNWALNCAGFPAATVTPGSNCARFKKLRPLRGRVSICCRDTTPWTVLDSKLIVGAKPEASTRKSYEPGASEGAVYVPLSLV